MSTSRVGNLEAALSLNTEDWKKNVSGAMKDVEKVSKQTSKAMGEDTQKAIQDTGKETKRVSWVMRGYIKDTARVVTGILISQAFYRMIGAIRELGREIHSLSQEFETLGISFRYLMGEELEHLAPSLMKDIKEFTSRTPYALEDTAGATRRLLAAGTDLSQVIDTLNILADVATVANVPIQELSQLMSSIRAKGRVTARELEQFGTMGIGARQILADQLGVDVDMLRGRFLTDIPLETAMNALLTGFVENFGGAALELSETWVGMMSTIRDNILLTMEKIYEPLYNYIRLNILPRIRAALAELLEGLEQRGPAYLLERFIPPHLHEAIRTIIAAFKHLAQSFLLIGSALTPVAGSFMEFFTIFGATFVPIIAGAVRILAQLLYMITQISPLVRFLASSFVALAIAAPVALRVLWLAKSIGLLTIASAAGRAIMYLVRALRLLLGALMLVKVPLVAAIGLILLLLTLLGAAIKPLGNLLGNLWQSLNKLLGLDTSKILQPIDTEDIEDLQGAIPNLTEDFEDLEDQIDETGKAFKKFLMSFDEVYNIPELDSGGAGDEDGIFTYPDIPFPELPDIESQLPDWDNLFNPEDFMNTSWWDLIVEWWDEWWHKNTKWKIANWLINVWETLETVWKYLTDPIKEEWETFKKSVSDGWEGLKEGWEEFKIDIGERWSTFWADLGERWEDFKQPIVDGWNEMWTNAGKAWNKFRNFLRSRWDGFWGPLKTKWEDFKEDVELKWSTFWANLTDKWEDFKTDVKDTWDTFWAGMPKSWDDFRKEVGRRWNEFWEGLPKKWEEFKTNTKKAWDTFWEGLPKKWEEFKTDVTTKWNEFWKDVEDRWEDFKEDFGWDKFWASIVPNWILFLIGLVTDWRNTWSSIQTAWEEFKVDLKQTWDDFWLDILPPGLVAFGRIILGLFTGSMGDVRTEFENTRVGRFLTSWNTFWEETLPGAFRGFGTNTSTGFGSGLATIGTSFATFRTGTFWTNWTTFWGTTLPEVVSNIRGTLQTRVGTAFGGLFAGWGTFRNDMSTRWSTFWGTTLPNVVSGIRNTLKNRLTTAFRGLFDAWNDFRKDLRTRWDRFWANLPIPEFNINIGGGLEGSNLGSGLENGVRPAVTRIKSWLEGIIEQWNNMRFGVTTSTTGNTVTTTPTTINPDSLARVGRMAKGGVVTRAMFAQIGEGGEREAVLPLNQNALRPFAEVLAEQIGARDPGEQLPPVYVGTLIASDQSLRELERRMKVVRIQEQHRVGGL